jgi:hypothetical protein
MPGMLELADGQLERLDHLIAGGRNWARA